MGCGASQPASGAPPHKIAQYGTTNGVSPDKTPRPALKQATGKWGHDATMGPPKPKDPSKLPPPPRKASLKKLPSGRWGVDAYAEEQMSKRVQEQLASPRAAASSPRPASLPATPAAPGMTHARVVQVRAVAAEAGDGERLPSGQPRVIRLSINSEGGGRGGGGAPAPAMAADSDATRHALVQQLLDEAVSSGIRAATAG